MKKSFIAAFAIVALAASGAFATVQIGIPNDATNGARAIKLLEKAGLITVNPAAGFSPELKDITGEIYDVEVVPVAANTLPATLDDFAASTINGTYAIPAGFIPSRDALIIEKQDEGAENPFVNIIACRAGEKDNPVFQKIVSAYQTQLVAQFILVRFKESCFPAWNYEPKFDVPENFVESHVGYESKKEGKAVVKIGVCGSAHDQWYVVQKVLDERGDNIYIELVEFDAYNLPNEALNSGEIDLNAFQHKAYMNKEIASQGYKIEVAGDTIMAPLSLYSRKVKTLDELKALAGKK